MAATHRWKIYTAEGEYIGSVKIPLYGAMLLAGMGEPGATIREGHRAIKFTDFVDSEASNSYDRVVEIVDSR